MTLQPGDAPSHELVLEVGARLTFDDDGNVESVVVAGGRAIEDLALR